MAAYLIILTDYNPSTMRSLSRRNKKTCQPFGGCQDFLKGFFGYWLKVNGWVFRSVIRALDLYSFQNVGVNSCFV